MPSKDGTSNLHPSAITCDRFQNCSLLYWVTLQTVGQRKSGGKRCAGAGVKLRRRRALGSGQCKSSPAAKKKPSSTCKPPDCISSSNPPGNNNSRLINQVMEMICPRIPTCCASSARPSPFLISSLSIPSHQVSIIREKTYLGGILAPFIHYKYMTQSI